MFAAGSPVRKFGVLQDSLPCLRTEWGKFIWGLPLGGKLAEGEELAYPFVLAGNSAVQQLVKAQA